MGKSPNGFSKCVECSSLHLTKSSRYVHYRNPPVHGSLCFSCYTRRRLSRNWNKGHAFSSHHYRRKW